MSIAFCARFFNNNTQKDYVFRKMLYTERFFGVLQKYFKKLLIFLSFSVIIHL